MEIAVLCISERVSTYQRQAVACQSVCDAADLCSQRHEAVLPDG